jgi:hypothetical protein
LAFCTRPVFFARFVFFAGFIFFVGFVFFTRLVLRACLRRGFRSLADSTAGAAGAGAGDGVTFTSVPPTRLRKISPAVLAIRSAPPRPYFLATSSGVMARPVVGGDGA